jgi:hypothetical protein
MKPVPPNTVMEPATTHPPLHSLEIARAMHHRARSALFKFPACVAAVLFAWPLSGVFASSAAASESERPA